MVDPPTNSPRHMSPCVPSIKYVIPLQFLNAGYVEWHFLYFYFILIFAIEPF